MIDPGNRLYPGQFVRVYVDGNYIHNVISIPLRSVLQTSSGPIVYVLDDANVPAVRNIKIIKTIKNTCLIEEGLKEGERIVVDGVQRYFPAKPSKYQKNRNTKRPRGIKPRATMPKTEAKADVLCDFH